MIKNSCYLIVFLLLTSCNADHAPKPRGYFRIELPPKKYELYTGTCPYTFMKPVYAHVIPDSSRDAEPCWLNLDFPQFQAKVHLSYKNITGKSLFGKITEDAHELAFKHTIKATAINEGMISRSRDKVYGIYYDIAGNTASSVQFYLTDSTQHYLRGALYFFTEPKLDSIQPVLSFIKDDIDVMINTLKWK